ncbi:MAG: hypothetical protein EOO56_12985 [Hymenobacter sp.]|nr:MAG: hypothetical protein EOO56_12985 [Hymenobacter sp.]
MRYILTGWLLLGTLLAARAQMHKSLLFNGKPLPGTYILNADRQTRRTANLRVYARELLAQDDQGHTTHYKPAEVYWVRIGRLRYTTAQGFKTKSGLLAARQAGRLFVEVVDSGQISLFRYRSYVGGPNSVTTELETYMLRQAPADSVVTVPVSAYTGKGKRFREVLLPYLISRPDLRQLVEYGAITIDTLPALLHAFNSGEPFPFTTIGRPAANPPPAAVQDPAGH